MPAPEAVEPSSLRTALHQGISALTLLPDCAATHSSSFRLRDDANDGDDDHDDKGDDAAVDRSNSSSCGSCSSSSDEAEADDEGDDGDNTNNDVDLPSSAGLTLLRSPVRPVLPRRNTVSSYYPEEPKHRHYRHHSSHHRHHNHAHGHGAHQPHVTPHPSQPPRPCCSVCGEQPSVYGLLQNCDHVFCVSCLRQWRQRGTTNDIGELTSIFKSCPLCRTPSLICVRSLKFLTGQEKDVWIDRALRGRQDIPCRYFTKSLSSSRSASGGFIGPFCPLGDDCFYLHALPGGEGQPPRQYHFGMHAPQIQARVALHQRVAAHRSLPTSAVPSAAPSEDEDERDSHPPSPPSTPAPAPTSSSSHSQQPLSRNLTPNTNPPPIKARGRVSRPGSHLLAMTPAHHPTDNNRQPSSLEPASLQSPASPSPATPPLLSRAWPESPGQAMQPSTPLARMQPSSPEPPQSRNSLAAIAAKAREARQAKMHGAAIGRRRKSLPSATEAERNYPQSHQSTPDMGPSSADAGLPVPPSLSLPSSLPRKAWRSSTSMMHPGMAKPASLTFGSCPASPCASRCTSTTHSPLTSCEPSPDLGPVQEEPGCTHKQGEERELGQGQE